MGFIRTLFILLIVFILAAGGYWLYATKTGTADEIWVTVNTYMFDPLKSWSCDEIVKNGPPNAPRPASC